MWRTLRESASEGSDEQSFEYSEDDRGSETQSELEGDGLDVCAGAGASGNTNTNGSDNADAGRAREGDCSSEDSSDELARLFSGTRRSGLSRSSTRIRSQISPEVRGGRRRSR